jgi:translocation and assembly module TamA
VPSLVRPPWCIRAGLAAVAIAVACAIPAEAGADGTAARYRVTIDAPSPLKEAIERSVRLVRWQDYAEMTDDLRDRLMREAVEETRNIAAAEGHFSATIDITVARDTDPAVVTLRVEAGPLARVTAVRIAVTGPASTDAPSAANAISKVEREWSLPEGAVFRQAAWLAAKERAVATLAAGPYAAAKLEKSEASIDPDRQSAELAVELASGPAFRFGDVRVSGLAKYSEALVRNYGTIAPGDPYSEAALERYVRRLNASGYFASAHAKVDAETTHPEDATVFVAVIEAPTRRLEAGIGYSTDVQFRANANYRDVNVDDHGLQLYVDARAETKIQSASLRLSRPPNDVGWLGTFGAGAERTDIEGLVTRTAAIGTRWRTVAEDDERAVSATYYHDEQVPSGAPSQIAHAVYLELERYWRRVDNLIAPSKGFIASLQAGGGVPGASTRGFGRVLGRFAAWLPIDRTHEIGMRAEGGAVLAGSRIGIPSKLLFRTGGDTTVRGYAFESLGVQDGDAIVPGRYYAVASVDVTRWMTAEWGLAAFDDAGNAVDSLSDARFVWGYGVGARVRTPLGPFRFDVAYGQQSHEVRAHVSVGLSF